MSDRTQIGPDVDADLWDRFREDVEERYGKIRGVLGKELDTALRQHLGEDTRPAERRIEQRLIRIEDALETSKPDGGATVSEDIDTHTHRADAGRIESKPDPKAPREDKTRYLAQCVVDHLSDDFEQCPRCVLVNLVRDEYGFRRDTAEGYVSELIDWFDLVDHPQQDNFPNDMLVTRERFEELLAQEADEELAELDQ
jgi:hypothetical protein